MFDLLDRRPLGRTGIDVPPVGIGCAPLGDMPETFGYSVGEGDAVATVLAALDSPIAYLDTAALYGDGESERRIGLALSQIGGLPEGAVLQTKIGAEPDGRFDATSTRRRFERSLRLLDVERIEVVYLHDPESIGFDAAMATDGPVAALQVLRDERLIGHVGVAGGPIDLMMRFVGTGEFEAVITHNRYTLLNRVADPLLTLAHERGIGVLNAAPYGSGMLAKGPDAYPRYAYREADETLVERTRRLETICARHGVPLAVAALQFSLRDARITSTIVGMSQPQRIAETIDLMKIDVPDEVWREIDAVPYERTEPR